MKSRRKFIRFFFGFFITLITLKYFKIVTAMSSLPYHHLPDGTFRNLPGSPKRPESRHSGNFFRFFYKGIIKREMFDQKEIPDNIKEELDIKPVKWIDEVLNLVLTSQPVPWEKEEEISNKVSNKKRSNQKKSIGTH